MNDQTEAWLGHYEDPYHRGSCEYATHHAEREVACCGSVLVVELQIRDGVVEEAWFDGDGCQLGQAVASLLMEAVEQRPTDELRHLSIPDIAKLLGEPIPEKHRPCCQLACDTLLAALDSPIDDEQGPSFLGPDLGDEC